jgi:hypothetical protein
VSVHKWSFCPIPISERMEILCHFKDLALEINPDLAGKKDAQPTQGRVRIDVQTSTPGLSFKDGWTHRNTLEYQGQSFYVASREDLISSKKAAGRTVDLDDVRLLELPNKKDAG